MLQSWEDFFQRLRNHDEITRTLVTIATAIGIAWILITVLGIISNTIKVFYVFVWSRLSRLDLRKRYGQWAVISGATDGIGLGIAKELARRGHSIIIIGRNQQKLDRVKETLKTISKNPIDVLPIKIDLAHATIKDFERVRDEIDPNRREIGILINNAGIFPSEVKRYLSHDPDNIREHVTVNISSLLMLTRFIMPTMAERRRGIVINVSSTLGRVPFPYFSVYCATKAAVCSFSDTLRMEYSDHPVEVLTLVPGGVSTRPNINWTGGAQSAIERFMTPSPDDYARSALATVGRVRTETTGYWPHSIILSVVRFIRSLGLLEPFSKTMVRANSKEQKISPLPQRKASNSERVHGSESA